MVYTQYISRRLVPAQLKKFKEAVQSKEVGIDEHSKPSLREKVRQLMPRLRKGRWDKPGVWASRNTRTPTLGYIVPPGRALEAAFGSVEEFGPFVVTEPNSPENMADYADHPVVLEYLGRLNDGEARPGLEHVSDLVSAKWLGGTQWGETPVPMGRIGFIQEPGYKLRSVANPWSILQVIGSHLGNQLYDTLLHDIPEDCTFDQDQGVRDVQTYLRDSDQDLMSIDLSSRQTGSPCHLL
jgi:hypothetical protein